MIRPLCLVLLLAPVFACAESDPITELRDAVAARLLLMQDVARFKWNAQLPIADPAREAAVLEQVTRAAVEAGVPEAYARSAVAAQMQAARAIQAELFERWRPQQHGPFPDVPDLATVQRPRIDRATTRLLDALAHARCALRGDAARRRLTAVPPQLDGFGAAWRVATAALFAATACVS